MAADKMNASFGDAIDVGNRSMLGGAPPVMEHVWLRSIFIVIYAIIFVLGVSGNALVVFVVVRKKHMHTITNIFITNLAVSDIMMCLLAVIFTPLSGFLPSWVLGKELCHLLPMSLGVCVYVSTLTSAAIAIDRYFVIVYPFKPRMRTGVCLMIIAAIWIISISISLPLAVYQKMAEENNVMHCKEHWPKPTARKFFTVTSLILQYVVPCLLITFCYTKVSRVLRERARRHMGSHASLEIKRKRRTNKMLIAMVCIFVCCWMPLNITLTASEYRESITRGHYFELIFFCAHVIAMSSTIYNPFLYAWMNDNFKKEFKLVAPCLFFSSSSNLHNGAATQYTTIGVPNAARPTEAPVADPEQILLSRRSEKDTVAISCAIGVDAKEEAQL